MQQQQNIETRQSIPVNLYRTPDRVVVAAPMPGLQPEDLSVEVTSTGCLVLQGGVSEVLREEMFNVQDVRWQQNKEVLLDEWNVGGYYREVDLPAAVDAELGIASLGDGVLVVSLPLTRRLRPAQLALVPLGQLHRQRVGSAGHPVQPLSTAEQRATTTP